MKYILKVWICTCLAAPILLFLFNIFYYQSFNYSELFFNFSDLRVYLGMVWLGLLFSFPTFFILFLIKLIDSRKKNIKYILTTIGILGTFISFFILDNHFFKRIDDFIWVFAYSFSISIFIWVFKLDKP